MNSRKNGLVLSMALNGYQIIYKDCLQSQKDYADRFGFDYVAISRPYFTRLWMACCWLKLVLIQSALENGYPWVLFVDSDAEIRSWCPDFRSLSKPGKSLYMANGSSGRVNSGVIIAKNEISTIKFFSQVLDHFGMKLPIEDRVTEWGENGHIIHFSKGQSFLEILPSDWNNSLVPESQDFIRHYTGIMRQFYRPNPFAKTLLKFVQLMEKMKNKNHINLLSKNNFREILMSLYSSSIKGNEAIFKDSAWKLDCRE